MTDDLRKAVGRKRMKEREVFLDKLRVLATCAVVLLHTVSGVADITDMSLYPQEQKVFLTVLDLVCWCVPVFLLISGYLFLNPGRQISAGKIVTKYCRRIVLALFVFGVPYGCMELTMAEGRFRPGMVTEAFMDLFRAKTWAHMWYLYLVLLLYLVTPLVRWVLFAVPRWAVYAMLLVLLAGCSIMPWLHDAYGWTGGSLPGDGIYFFYYICGYLFAVGEREKIERAVRRGIVPVLTVLAAAAMVASRLLGGQAWRMAYNYPPIVLLALLLFAWGLGAKHTARPFWSRTSALSFGVYLVHPVFLNLAYKYFGFTPLSLLEFWGHGRPAFLGLSLGLFFGGTLLSAAAMAAVLRKIPLLRRHVL